jgi:hypothetical protein
MLYTKCKHNHKVLTSQGKGELAMDKDNKLSLKDQHIYTGIDVGKKAWSVTVLTEQFEHKTFSQPPVPETLVKYLSIPVMWANVIVILQLYSDDCFSQVTSPH